MAPIMVREDARRRQRFPRILLILSLFLILAIPAFGIGEASRSHSFSCVPSSSCNGNPSDVSAGGRLKFTGRGLRPGFLASFPARRGRVVAKLRRSVLGLIVTVPTQAVSGRLYLRSPRARSADLLGTVHVFQRPLYPASPVDGPSAWIFYLNEADGGDLNAIVAQAQAAGIKTLIIKSGDGVKYWSQFSPSLVATLHAAGLRVCAWQYVYGSHPAEEAEVAAAAATSGADCFIIDAETEYEGRYAAAQTYMQTLRQRVGDNYPLGLASFPLVTEHPFFPYSVFLGPGGAQINMPQMYWKTIGVSAESLYASTYSENSAYQRQLFPLGQTFEGVSPGELLSFRSLANAYNANGYSIWEWHETSAAQWKALEAPASSLDAPLTAPVLGLAPAAGPPVLKTGDAGDLVLWMQEHLLTVFPGQPIDGEDGAITTQDLGAFQSAHGLPSTGEADPATWQKLLQVTPTVPNWSVTPLKY